MSIRRVHLVLAVAACAALGMQSLLSAVPEAATPSAESPVGPGLTKEAAIEVCRPDGERAYFERLRCEDGSRVRYKRSGSFGYRNEPRSPEDNEAVQAQMFSRGPVPPGQRDFHMVDGFEVRCGKKAVTIYADMYHCPEPATQEVPPGLTLQPAGGSR